MSKNKLRSNRLSIYYIHFILLLIVIIITQLITNYIFSGATKYCPLSHKFNAHMHCQVIDTKDNKKLIEHINTKTLKWSLSVYNKKNIWIVHPKKFINDYRNKSFYYSIHFDSTYSDSLIFKGKRYPIINR